LAQPIRLLLAFTETDYEEKTFELGPMDDYRNCEWFQIKQSLGLDFPNLPYYMDGDRFAFSKN
jgi:glutathione S-transferase